MGTIKADTVTGLADPNKATIPNTITMGSTTATLNFGNTAIANASAGSSTITGEGGSTTTNLQQGLAKAWFHIVSGGASTIALGDSFNATSISDGGTGIYNFNIANDMANAVYSLTVSTQAGAGFPDKPQINSQATGSFQSRQAHATDEVDSGIYNATVHGDLA